MRLSHQSTKFVAYGITAEQATRIGLSTAKWIAKQGYRVGLHNV